MSASAAPVTPVRTTFLAFETNPPAVDVRRRAINPRKRRLPESPTKPAFPTSSPPRTRPHLATHNVSLSSSGTTPTPISEHPFAPLLPPAPVFDMLPLPPLTPTSSPMRRSPAMRDLAAFTREAYAAEEGEGEGDEARWAAGSVSRLELGAGRRRVAVWDRDEEAEVGAPFHLELDGRASPALGLGLGLELGLELGLGLALGVEGRRFGEDDLPLRSTLQSPFSTSGSSSPAYSPTPTYGSTPSLSSSLSSRSSSSSSGCTCPSSIFAAHLEARSPSLPFAHLSLSPTCGSSDSSPTPPSSLAMRRLDALEQRRAAAAKCKPIQPVPGAGLGLRW